MKIWRVGLLRDKCWEKPHRHRVFLKRERYLSGERQSVLTVCVSPNNCFTMRRVGSFLDGSRCSWLTWLFYSQIWRGDMIKNTKYMLIISFICLTDSHSCSRIRVGLVCVILKKTDPCPSESQMLRLHKHILDACKRNEWNFSLASFFINDYLHWLHLSVFTYQW